jgi:hypothetical protein
MSSNEPQFDVFENIMKHINQLKPWVPKQAVICIGEYPAKILLKGSLIDKTDEALTLFIGKSEKEIAKWSQSRLKANNILGLDPNIDTHFWFNVLPHITKNDAFMEGLKNKLVDKQCDAIMVASVWDGVGSALLPALISQFKEWNINSVALAILPSKIQPSDVHFNALSSMGMFASEDLTPVVLIDRDHLENYVGVDRKGTVIIGNTVINYLLELMLAKETLAQELSELSRSLSVRMYTVLSATAASLKIYGSIEKMLQTALLRPLLAFDLSGASLLYVLIRMPVQLKDRLSRGKIELAMASWFKERSRLKSIYISEPIYVEDVGDRIDVVMFMGGFDLTELFASMEKKVSAIKSNAIERGLLSEEEWQGIDKNLKEN